MATDATGVATSPDSIPTYNTSVDAPSGLGFNAAMAAIQTALSARPKTPAGIATGEAMVWNGTTFVRSSATNIGPTSLGSGAPDATKFLRGDGSWVAPGGVATGVIEMFGAAAAPAGYLLCDGSAVSRTTYAALFAVIASGYGAGDGSTTFNVPDLRGRVPVGLGTNASVNALNANDGQAVANRRPQHRHTPHSHTGGGSLNSAVSASAPTPFSSVAVNTGTADGGSGVGTDALDTPSFVVVNYIVKT